MLYNVVLSFCLEQHSNELALVGPLSVAIEDDDVIGLPGKN